VEARSIKGLFAAGNGTVPPPAAASRPAAPAAPAAIPMPLPMPEEPVPARTAAASRRFERWLRWPYLAGAGAAALLLILAGVFLIPGLFKKDPAPQNPDPGAHASGPEKPKDGDQNKNTGNTDNTVSSATTPDYLKYIAADFNAAVILHPQRLLKSPLLAGLPLHELQHMTEESGIDPGKLERVILLLDPAPKVGTVSLDRPAPPVPPPAPLPVPPIQTGQPPADESVKPMAPARVLKVENRFSLTFKTPLHAVAFDPNGKMLVTGGGMLFESDLRFLALEDGKTLATLEGHRHAVRSLAFVSNGQTLAVGDEDAQVKFWDVATKQAKNTLSGQEGAISALAVTGDGKTLASLANDLRRWSSGIWTRQSPEPRSGRKIKSRAWPSLLTAAP
jgi:WD40 repeat protein